MVESETNRKTNEKEGMFYTLINVFELKFNRSWVTDLDLRAMGWLGHSYVVPRHCCGFVHLPLKIEGCRLETSGLRLKATWQVKSR